MHQPERRETEQGAGYRYQPPLFDTQNVQEPLRPPKKRDGCVNAFIMLVSLGVVFILLLAVAAALLVFFSVDRGTVQYLFGGAGGCRHRGPAGPLYKNSRE